MKRIMSLYAVVFLMILSFKTYSSSQVTDSEVMSGKIMGEIIFMSKNDSRNLYGSEYYIKIKKEQDTYLYPLKVEKKDLIEKLKGMKDKMVLFTGHLRNEEKIVFEHKTNILCLEPIDLEVMDLKKLSLNSKDQMLNEKTPYELYKGQMNSQGNNANRGTNGIGIPDKAANAIIFASGAALLAKILLGGSQ